MHEIKIEGEHAARFEPVAQAFRENFATNAELGAAVAIYHRNELVVDLWGGVRDAASRSPWQRETITCMMSVAKGVSMTCLAMAADRGLIALDRPVADYWPEFAAQGKGETTVRQALGHLAGIPVTDLAEPGDIYDWEKMVKAVAGQKPLWPVGEVQVYHSSTLGFIAGELLRRVTGKTLGTFLAEEICSPLVWTTSLALTTTSEPAVQQWFSPPTISSMRPSANLRIPLPIACGNPYPQPRTIIRTPGGRAKSLRSTVMAPRAVWPHFTMR